MTSRPLKTCIMVAAVASAYGIVGTRTTQAHFSRWRIPFGSLFTGLAVDAFGVSLVKTHFSTVRVTKQTPSSTSEFFRP